MNVDTTALNGLRGFAALHVLLYHALQQSLFQFIIYGSVSLLFSNSDTYLNLSL